MICQYYNRIFKTNYSHPHSPINSSKTFGKIFLKAIRDFFQYLVFDKGRGGTGDSVFWWWSHQTEGESSNCRACRETPQFPPLIEHPNPPISKTLRKVLGLLTVIILKGMSESIFFKATILQHLRLTMKKMRKFLADIQSTEDYQFISTVRNI